MKTKKKDVLIIFLTICTLPFTNINTIYAYKIEDTNNKKYKKLKNQI